MAQACRDDLHSGTANRIVNSLHPNYWGGTIQFPIIAGNELSYLQQIQGGQQIGEETAPLNFSRIPRVAMGNQLTNRQLTCVGMLSGR